MSGRARTLAALPAVVFAAWGLAAGGLAGCAGPDAAAGPDDPGGAPVVPGTPGGDPGAATFSMQLTVGGGIRFDQVSYDFSGNGFHKAGTIDVAAEQRHIDRRWRGAVRKRVRAAADRAGRRPQADALHRHGDVRHSGGGDRAGPGSPDIPHELAAPTAQAVPVPRWATLMVAALLLTLGTHAVRRPGGASKAHLKNSRTPALHAGASSERRRGPRSGRLIVARMSKVLVTGGSGFVGSHCIVQLLAAGHEVRTTVRSLAREGDVRAMLKEGGVRGRRLADVRGRRPRPATTAGRKRPRAANSSSTSHRRFPRAPPATRTS